MDEIITKITTEDILKHPDCPEILKRYFDFINAPFTRKLIIIKKDNKIIYETIEREEVQQ